MDIAGLGDLFDVLLTVNCFCFFLFCFFKQTEHHVLQSISFPPHRCSGVFDLSILEVESTEETGPKPHTGDKLSTGPLLIVCTFLL